MPEGFACVFKDGDEIPILMALQEDDGNYWAYKRVSLRRLGSAEKNLIMSELNNLNIDTQRWIETIWKA